ncbi:hypothetical protein HS99_0005570 [Kitasatospora aureofaciens]|uniref:Uncharacterized protein n=1 Tax=Kitasatospora aureofaciens TaxID=1894 RepID=A0A1E7N999_KITAU|nr:hypothetical protein HS99_0005570 [Kitasatospora aureofaciens]
MFRTHLPADFTSVSDGDGTWRSAVFEFTRKGTAAGNTADPAAGHRRLPPSAGELRLTAQSLT